METSVPHLIIYLYNIAPFSSKEKVLQPSHMVILAILSNLFTLGHHSVFAGGGRDQSVKTGTKLSPLLYYLWVKQIL